jgi:L-fuconolactonase
MIDSHVHLWQPHRLRYSWLDQFPALNRPFLPRDFREASSGMAEFIFVEGGTDAGQGLTEVAWAAELAAKEPWLKGIVAQSTLAPDELEKLAEYPLVKGVRPNLLKRINTEGMRLLAQWGFSCDLCVMHPQLPEIIRLAADHPAIMFILDHCGKPGVREQMIDPWRQHIRELAALPNVCCKLSGLATEADHRNWHPSHLQPYIEHVVECFTFDRVLFGSDWPVATLATSYLRWVETLRGAVGGASEIDLKKLFHDNAKRIYRV